MRLKLEVIFKKNFGKGCREPISCEWLNRNYPLLKEMLIANSIQVDTLAQLLIEKGIILEREYFIKLKKSRWSMRVKRQSGNDG